MKEIGVMVSIIMLGVTCFIDDRTPLPSWLRLSIQVLATFIIFAAGSRIYTITNPIGGILKLDTLTITLPLFGSLPIQSGVITMGWLLLTINAMNWFDGVSGQVSVVSFLGFVMIGLLAYFRNGEPDIALLSFILAGIAGAGILFDFPPARMLMGDSGSMFFGLLLGILGVYQGGKIATAFLALGIPLTDALFVILGRIMRKKSPFKGGRDHLHHRLLRVGFSERTIVLLTALIGVCFGGPALFLSTAEKGIAVAVLLVIMATVSIVLKRKSS
jgi:UDP-N-acetylmuramyl pentapeptide phosphotransferase/UDP-N-acetylglucosamine-1-phosphate transferase